MKFITTLFDPLCRTQMHVIGREQIPVPGGLSCRPCIRPTDFVMPCNCCWKCVLSGFEDGTDVSGLCGAMNMTFYLSPDSDTQFSETDGADALVCTFLEPPESRGDRAFGFSMSVGSNPDAPHEMKLNLGPAGSWFRLGVVSACSQESYVMTWAGANPPLFPGCTGGPTTVTVTRIPCTGLSIISES